MIKAFHSHLLQSQHAFFTKHLGIERNLKTPQHKEHFINTTYTKNWSDYFNQKFSHSPQRFFTAGQQIHSSNVIIVEEPFLTLEKKVDAYVTNKKNIFLCVYTADCCPILLEDTSHHVIAAIHAGWKGTALGVIQNTINAMLEKGAHKQSIRAVIGPCIYQQSFEIQNDFVHFFEKNVQHSVNEFILYNNQKMYFDLVHYIQSLFKKMGIQTHSTIPINTYEKTNNFFSYRHSTHHQSQFGSQISAIGL